MLNELLKIGEYEIEYDGERLSDHFVVRSINFPMLPNITAGELLIDGKPGSWFTGRNIGTRDITIGLGLINSSRSGTAALEAWVQHSNLVGKNKEAKLDFGNGYYVNAVMVGSSEITRNGKWSTTEATFRCFDPYIYGETHEVELSSGKNTVFISGKVPVSPVFEIVSDNADSLEVVNDISGKLVKVYNPGVSVPVIIDMGLHKCTIGGAYKPSDPHTTDFWTFNPGEQSVSIKNGSGKMTYTETYL